MRPKTKIFKMATGPKAGLYQNAQSASYLPPTLTGIKEADSKNYTKNVFCGRTSEWAYKHKPFSA